MLKPQHFCDITRYWNEDISMTTSLKFLLSFLCPLSEQRWKILKMRPKVNTSWSAWSRRNGRQGLRVMLAEPSALASSRSSSRPPICFNSHSTHPSPFPPHHPSTPLSISHLTKSQPAVTTSVAEWGRGEEEEEEVDSELRRGSQEGKGLFIRNLDVHLCSDTILHMSASSKWECGRDHKLCWETHGTPRRSTHTHSHTYCSRRAPARSTAEASFRRRAAATTGRLSASRSRWAGPSGNEESAAVRCGGKPRKGLGVRVRHKSSRERLKLRPHDSDTTCKDLWRQSLGERLCRTRGKSCWIRAENSSRAFCDCSCNLN